VVELALPIFLYTAYSLLAFIGLYLYYIALMTGHKWLKGTQWHKVVEVLVWPFLVLDWAVNVFVLSIWFLELPGYPTEVVTERLKRWRREYENQNYNKLNSIKQRRLIFAETICDEFLDYFDTMHNGDHC